LCTIFIPFGILDLIISGTTLIFPRIYRNPILMHSTVNKRICYILLLKKLDEKPKKPNQAYPFLKPSIFYLPAES
jgi:hypothetical protein